MKTLIALVAVLGTTSAFACANFAGSFTCTIEDDNYTYNVLVEQDGYNFRMTDDEGTDEFIADGQRRRLPDDTNMRNAAYVASCQGQSVVMNMTGEIYDDETGQSFPFTANMNHNLRTRNHVTQTTVTEVLGQTSTTITHCQRN
ncbi:MAG: hypothetical protein CME70_12295 [Halobacteriovorax sp.]|nr:hypothetical protein [Halobacteriovorax sp.]|tara:strand:+ start:267121 stop:267552 length:432 start_codon:yes stop_codon:yes gene_type:complete